MEDEVPMLVSQEGEQVEEEKLLARLERKQKKKVPITLITGFLGSGKVRHHSDRCIRCYGIS